MAGWWGQHSTAEGRLSYLRVDPMKAPQNQGSLSRECDGLLLNRRVSE